MSATMVFGWGGVKLEVVSAGLSVVFPANRAYCTQPTFEPVIWEQESINGKDLSELDGYRVKLTVFFENVSTEDYLLIEDLVAVINLARSLQEPIRVYPKWNTTSPTCVAFDCKLKNAIAFQDASQKVACGQRLPDMNFVSEELLDQVPFWTEGVYLQVLAVDSTHGLGTDNGKWIQL